MGISVGIYCNKFILLDITVPPCSQCTYLYIHCTVFTMDNCILYHSAKGHVKSYADYLEAVYKRSHGGGNEWLPGKIHCYINLRTVCKIEDLSQNEEVMCVKALMHAEIEKVNKLKKPIKISQVCVTIHICILNARQCHLPHVI